MVHVGLLRIYSGFIYGRLMVLEVIEADLGVFSPAGWIKDYLQNVFRHQSHQRTEGTKGPEDQRTKGPQEDQGTRGPRDQRTKGPENQGTRKPRDQGTKGEDWRTGRFKDHKIWKLHKRAKTLHQRRKNEYIFGDPLFFLWCLKCFFLMPYFFFGTPCLIQSAARRSQAGKRWWNCGPLTSIWWAGRLFSWQNVSQCLVHVESFLISWRTEVTSASQSAWCTCQDATRTHWGESVSHPKQYCQLCATVVPSGAPIKGDGARFSSVAGQLRKQNGVQHRPPAPRPGQQECVQPSARRCQHRQHSTF